MIHTIYEPGSFTPLIQLIQARKARPDFIARLEEQITDTISRDAMRGILTDPEAINALINERLDNVGLPVNAKDFIKTQLQQLVQGRRRESNMGTDVRYYLCDHLGTPQALINIMATIDWQVAVDIWGGIRKYYLTNDIHQSLELPG